MLNRVFGITCALLLLSSCSYSNIKATVDPTDIGIGAKPTGMGKAFTAVTGDINNIFINPAGLSSLKAVELTSMYTNLLGDINYSLLGVSYPTSAGTFGIGYVGIQTGDVIVTGLDSSGRPIDIGSRIGYANNVLILSYGNTLERWARLWSPLNDMTMGLNVKLFSESFRGTGGQSAIGTDLDLGFTYKPRPYLTFGLLGKNFLHYESPIGGTLSWTNGTRESIPALLKLGAAMKFFGKDAPKQFRGQDVLGSIDLDLNPNGSYPSLLHMGVEWLPTEFLAIRAGLEQSYGGAGVNPATNNLTAGIGLKARNLSFDYAYRKDNVLSENSNHYVSISFKLRDFASPEKKAAPEEEKKKPAAVLTLKYSVPDVPDSHWAKPAVDYVLNEKILSMYPDGKFRPDKSITRADLAVMLVKSKFAGFPPQDTVTVSFKDVPSGHWARRMIGVAAGQGLLKGYPDKTFKPNNNTSVMDATYAFSRLGNLAPSKPTGGLYGNISETHFASGQIKAAKDKGMLDFIKTSDFPVNAPITRAQAAWMLYKLKN